jgi:hypothetical protein
MSTHNEQTLPEIPVAEPEFEPESLSPENHSALGSYVRLAVGIATVAVTAGLHITWKEARDAEKESLKKRDNATSKDEEWNQDQDSQRWSRVRGALEDGIDPDPDDLR